MDNAVAAALSWDAAHFPCAWVWTELGGTKEAPWNGCTRLIGIEPCTTMPAAGIVKTRSAGGKLLRLEPGATHSTGLRLHVCKPNGPITSIDTEGRIL
jgi:hypothetical protein